MRRAGGIVSLTGIAVAIALATPLDSPSGLAQGRLAGQSRQAGGSRAAAKPYTTWQSYAGGGHSSQYSALDQINRKNVAKLQVAWSYPITGNSIFNPVVVDEVMYAPVGGGALAAIDAATGKEIWRKEGAAPSGARGMNYWESPDRSDRRFIYLQRGDVIAVNARDGELITSFGNNGRVDLREAMERKPANPVGTSNPGRIFENLFIIPLPGGPSYGGPPSDVHAYDVLTGKLAWIFHVIPHEGEFGYDTWPEGHWTRGGGGHNWSEFTVDEENGIAFVGFGSPRYDFYGGDRKGNNLFANSLVAIDARTGKRIWHQQLIHHDLWDWDIPQSAKLLTIRQNGKPRQVVAQATKQGFLYVFDRKTGQPIWPIEERPVPQGTIVPGEALWPTQPFPTAPPPFSRQRFTVEDLNPHILTSDEREQFKQRVARARNDGPFTPIGFDDVIHMPGNQGGSNWGSTAGNPTDGSVYVIGFNVPTIIRLLRPGETRAGTRGGPPEVVTEGRYVTEGFGLYPTIISPPYTTLTAYDLNQGTIKWQIGLGDDLRLVGQGVRGTGTAATTKGGIILTATGLLFVTAADRKVHVYDSGSGKQICEFELGGVTSGSPSMYERGGRQYLLVTAAVPGGRGGAEVSPGAATAPTGIVAYALPRN
jgi:glucose dehydrogenase